MTVHLRCNPHERLRMRTWRNEPYRFLQWFPVGPAISYDGKTWVNADPQADEPVIGKRNRTPE